MHRVVVAGTVLLTALGVVVLAGYLLLFSSSPDRAARAAPADTGLYLNVYLQPSSGQRASLSKLIERIPGFADPASLDSKLHQLAQRLLAEMGLDYEADLRSWLGDQVAVAVSMDAGASSPRIVLLVGCKDPALAESALPGILADRGPFTLQPYRGHDLMVGAASSYAVLEGLVVIGQTAQSVRAALDADAEAAPSLADSSAFRGAMDRVPSDHLASAYLNLPRLAALGGQNVLGGYTTVALALVADGSALHMVGDVPFDRGRASDSARQAFDMGSEPSSLADWMPAGTHGEIILFGVEQTATSLETQLRADPSLTDAVQAINSLRALAALGLGINIDRDFLPLFDHEAALALDRVSIKAPRGRLLLRPNDPAAAQGALDRMRAALVAHGSLVTTRDEAGVLITIVEVPQIATIAYAMTDGVVVLGWDGDAVAATIQAHASGNTLAHADAYDRPFRIAGGHGGNELWVNAAGLIELAGEIFDLGTEPRDILNQIGALIMTAPVHDDRLGFHAVLIVK
jgi:hypothetical protein